MLKKKKLIKKNKSNKHSTQRPNTWDILFSKKTSLFSNSRLVFKIGFFFVLL